MRSNGRRRGEVDVPCLRLAFGAVSRPNPLRMARPGLILKLGCPDQAGIVTKIAGGFDLVLHGKAGRRG